jgi:hypothetical protein
MFTFVPVWGGRRFFLLVEMRETDKIDYKAVGRFPHQPLI